MTCIRKSYNRRRCCFKLQHISVLIVGMTYACLCIINGIHFKITTHRVSPFKLGIYTNPNVSTYVLSIGNENGNTYKRMSIYELEQFRNSEHSTKHDSFKSNTTSSATNKTEYKTKALIERTKENKNNVTIVHVSSGIPNKLHQEKQNELIITNHSNENIKKFGSKELHTVHAMVNITKKSVRRLPHALIIGVKKCGTRALLEYLRLHPEIRAPGPEPHFFDRYYHLGLNWYREKMPLSLEGQITIEKTPRYFVSNEAPERVWNMSNETKLIIVVRDPVTRAISDFTQAASKQHYLSGITFEKKAFRRNGTGAINTHWSPIKTGFYALHLRRWLKYFPFSHIHLVSGEKLILDPARELDSVQDFLGIKRVITDKHFYFNETKGFPCLKKHEGSPETRCFSSSKGRPHSHVDENTLQILNIFFKPYNMDFYNLTSRDFGW